MTAPVPPRQFSQPGVPPPAPGPALECPGHECTQADALARIDAKLDQVLERLAKGDTNFATLQLRVRALEVVVYGGVGLGLVYLVNKVLLHSTP